MSGDSLLLATTHAGDVHSASPVFQPDSSGMEQATEIDAPLHTIQLWFYSAPGSLHPLSACDELHLLTEGRMKELAAEAIRAHASVASNVVLPESVWMVAQPVQDEPHTCLIGLHASPPNRSPVMAIAKFMTMLQAVERGMNTARQQIKTSSASISIGDANLVASTDPALTWKLIGSNVRTKVLEQLQSIGSKKGLLAVIAASLILLALIPIPYHVHCKVTCEPTTRRFVAAPFDATLIRAVGTVGQRVAQGDVLATLDGRELRSTLAGLQADHAQQIQLKLASLRTRDHSEAELARLRAEKLENEIRIVEQKLASLEVRSPIDGIIVSGDLEGAEGAPLKVGQTLFEIGHLDEMVAELQVPEAQVTHIDVGDAVNITLDSFGGQSLRTTIDTIHPRSELLTEGSVFVAEAKVPTATLELKPGMNGSASIATGYRSLGWVMLHRPFYRLRQFLGW